jgi:hypothetical protein
LEGSSSSTSKTKQKNNKKIKSFVIVASNYSNKHLISNLMMGKIKYLLKILSFKLRVEKEDDT